MVSVLLYVEVALSTRVCVNEYIVSLAGSVTPSLVHVTVVGGEPVEVQVRVVKEDETFRSNVTRGAAGRKEMYGRRLFDIQYGLVFARRGERIAFQLGTTSNYLAILLTQI